MNQHKRTAIFEQLRSANPNPATELEYRTPFELLVAVVLSAQATDRSVNLATRRLFAVADTPAAMLRSARAGLIPYIQTIGLYRTKAKNVIRLAELLLERHGGEVPRDRERSRRCPASAARPPTWS
jgi:endonuclease III